MPNIISITDFSDARLDLFARLSETDLLSRHQPEQGLFIAESPNVIERALRAGCIPVSILIETGELEKNLSSRPVESSHLTSNTDSVITQILTGPECKQIPVYTASFEVLSKLTGFQLTRGLLCAMKRPALPSMEDICRHARRIAILENVMNPTNVGAIFRSAAALNMDAVLLTAGCSNPFYRRASRVSMGTVFQIPWTYICPDIPKKSPENLKYKQTNTKPPCWPEDGMKQLRDLGFKTVAMALSENSISIDDPLLEKEEKLAIILGTEGDGLAATTIADCDYTVKIPMSHGVDSLNVAAASAVAFWQLGKQ